MCADVGEQLSQLGGGFKQGISLDSLHKNKSLISPEFLWALSIVSQAKLPAWGDSFEIGIEQ